MFNSKYLFYNLSFQLLVELVGILKTLYLAFARPLLINCQRVIIFTYNQATICLLNNPKRQFNQIIIIDIVQTIKLLRSKNI